MNEKSRLATRWQRFAGALIDGLLLIAFVLAIWWSTGMLQKMLSEETTTLSEQVLLFVIQLAIFTLLNSYLLYSRGQTIGKVIAKTKIVDMQGNKPNILKLLGLRYYLIMILRLIPIVGYPFNIIDVLFIFRKDHRCVHDHLAGTQVVDGSRARSVNN